jgi:hypothetical protein
VRLGGAPAAGVDLELRFFDGSSWSTRASTTTNGEGWYAFGAQPSLGAGQWYYVLYRNNSETAGRLWLWGTRSLSGYKTGDTVDLGRFDIANIALGAPGNGAEVALPFTFTWTPRPATPGDSYEFNLFDPFTNDPYFFTQPPLGYVGGYTLNTLPPGFSTDGLYVWDMWVYSPDGGYGISLEARVVFFSNSGAAAGAGAAPALPDRLAEAEARRAR